MPGSKFPWAEQSLQKASLKGVVAAIAEGLSLGRLAAAEVERFRFCRFELYGQNIRVLVRAVAEWLFGALATGTPKVAFVYFNFNRVGRLLGNNRFGHGSGS